MFLIPMFAGSMFRSSVLQSKRPLMACLAGYLSLSPGSADIYRAHPDDTGLERLTNDPSFDDQASISPDSRTMAFVLTRSGGPTPAFGHAEFRSKIRRVIETAKK
jgi:hypothetical protein